MATKLTGFQADPEPIIAISTQRTLASVLARFGILIPGARTVCLSENPALIWRQIFSHLGNASLKILRIKLDRVWNSNLAFRSSFSTIDFGTHKEIITGLSWGELFNLFNMVQILMETYTI